MIYDCALPIASLDLIYCIYILFDLWACYALTFSGSRSFKKSTNTFRWRTPLYKFSAHYYQLYIHNSHIIYNITLHYYVNEMLICI